jgi:mannose-1-phosphate guanylyltransferase
VWVTILAGGVGSRFWPASTLERPKQLLALGGPNPLIVDTVRRAQALAPDERIRILAAEHLVGPFRGVLGDFPESSYWVEPRARGTAPVLAWAAWKVARTDPDAVMVSLHADHLIHPVEALRECVESAVRVAARDDLLLSIGVEPDRVEPGYGHIELANRLETTGDNEAFRVAAFHEKPDPQTAERFVAKGYLWNTGIFVWKASVLLDEIRRHAPELAEHLPLIDENEAAFFDAVPVQVIDRAIMERSDRVGVVRGTFAWDDVGSWEALARTTPADGSGNIMVGHSSVIDGRSNIVYSDSGPVVLLGAEGLIVVRSGDTTMVIPRARAGEMKALLEQLDSEKA